jgi:NitT/TauT family transport system permease protein
VLSKLLRPQSLGFLSLILFLLAWQALALYLNQNTLPTPEMVLVVLKKEILSGELPYHLGVTLLRLLISFSLAMFIGCTLGILLGRYQKIDYFFDHWLVIFLNIPALVTIILCYVWFGLSEFAAILAVVINKIPNVIVTMREGTRTLNQELLDMANCYRFGKRKTFVHVIWPQLYPFVMATTRSGLALIWKIILVVELLGRSNGMGYQLNIYFQLFDVASILAYTLAFIVVIQLIEWLILKPLDRNAKKWRRV